MASLTLTRNFGPISYVPISKKTQPIVYPAAPAAPGTSVVGTPMTTDEISTSGALGVHAVLQSSFHPVMSVAGISHDPIPSGVLNPIIGTTEGASLPLSVQTVTSPDIAAVPQLSAPAVAPAVSANYSIYALIAAAVLLLYFVFKGE